MDVARTDWHEYDDWPAEQRSVRVGRWFAKGPAYEELRWRIADGAWSLEVGVFPDDSAVTYDSAERVVLAIRRQTLINRQANEINGGGPPPIPTLDASHIYWIQKHRDGLPGGDASGVCKVSYSTGEYTGLCLIARIAAEGVELLSVYGFEI